jgi:hypothetical protein
MILCWLTVEQQFIPALAIASDVVNHFTSYKQMMKKSILLFLIVWIPTFLIYSQNQPRKESIFRPGLSFSTLGKFGIFNLYQEDGDPTFSSISFYSLGMSVFLKGKKMVEFESGIYYSDHLIVVDSPSSYYPNYYPDQKIAIIEFPFNIRFDFPYCYVSTGFLADLQLKNSNEINDQSGLGFNTGFGVSYKFKCGVLVYAGPIFYMHNFFPIGEYKLSGRALKIGIAFN